MTGIVTFTPNPALDVSTTVARIIPDHKLRCTAARYDPGGGGINVARVVRRLGGEVTAIYPRGGVTGLTLDRLVEGEKVGCKTTDIAEETRLDFAAHEDAAASNSASCCRVWRPDRLPSSIPEPNSPTPTIRDGWSTR